VPLPTPEGPAITRRTARSGPAHDLGMAQQALALVAAQTAQPTALADVELVHDPPRLHLADTRERFEHAHDLELGERVVARALVEQALETERALLELRLHLRALTAGFRRLLECSLALLGGERRGQRHPATSGTTGGAQYTQGIFS